MWLVIDRDGRLHTTCNDFIEVRNFVNNVDGDWLGRIEFIPWDDTHKEAKADAHFMAQR